MPRRQGHHGRDEIVRLHPIYASSVGNQDVDSYRAGAETESWRQAMLIAIRICLQCFES